MLSRQVRIVGQFAFVMFLAAGGIYAWTAATPSVTAADVTDSKIKALLNDRLLTVQKIASVISMQFERGAASFAEVYEAKQSVHRAELDLCDTDKDRFRVLEKMLAAAKEFESNVLVAQSSGLEDPIEVLRAKASRLEVEISLERAIVR